jgi:hypothetical protein
MAPFGTDAHTRYDGTRTLVRAFRHPRAYVTACVFVHDATTTHATPVDGLTALTRVLPLLFASLYSFFPSCLFQTFSLFASGANVATKHHRFNVKAYLLARPA